MVVRMRSTKSHRNNRRSHFALTALSLVKDKDSNTKRQPHRASPFTGKYKGRQVINLEKKALKKVKKQSKGSK